MSRKNGLNRAMKILIPVTATILLAGCSVSPKPFTDKDRAKRIHEDRIARTAQQEPITHPINMYDAMARSVKYNLDLRLKAMETVVGKGALDLSKFDMLPNLAASAGYLWRDNLLASSSRSLTSTPPAPPSYSVDTNRWVSDLQLTYNLLDFGVSYINAKQKGDEYLITTERRRKMLQNIVRDSRYAYYRAVSAQKLVHQITPFIHELRNGLANSENIQSEKLESPVDQLRYRKALLGTLQQMTTLRRDLNHAKIELGSLMNEAPGSHFHLVIPHRETYPLPKHFPQNVRVLEMMALQDRPEIREEDYRSRIAFQDINKERLRMLPGVELGIGTNYDSNSFLVNRNWANAGATFTYNIMQVFQGPYAIKYAKSQKKVAEIRRHALGMAILTQVDVAKLRYNQALRELNVARKLRKLDAQIYKHLVNAEKAEKSNQLEIVQAKADRILSTLRYNLAYAEWQNAGGQLLNAVGFNPLNRVTTVNQPIGRLAREIRLSLESVPSLNTHKAIRMAQKTLGQDTNIKVAKKTSKTSSKKLANKSKTKTIAKATGTSKTVKTAVKTMPKKATKAASKTATTRTAKVAKATNTHKPLVLKRVANRTNYVSKHNS